MSAPAYFAEDQKEYQQWIDKIQNPSFWDRVTGEDFNTKQMLLANPPAGAVRHMYRMGEDERRRADEIKAMASQKIRMSAEAWEKLESPAPLPSSALPPSGPTFTATTTPTVATVPNYLVSQQPLPVQQPLTSICTNTAADTRAHADFLMSNLNQSWNQATQPGGLLHFGGSCFAKPQSQN